MRTAPLRRDEVGPIPFQTLLIFPIQRRCLKEVYPGLEVLHQQVVHPQQVSVFLGLPKKVSVSTIFVPQPYLVAVNSNFWFGRPVCWPLVGLHRLLLSSRLIHLRGRHFP